MNELPPCAYCTHRAWAHGTQSGFPANGEPCHAAVAPTGRRECSCTGYRQPASRPPTTDPTVPAAAVQIADGVLDAIGYTDTGIEARAVCEALAAAGWLHDPARVAELEAESERLRAAVDAGHCPSLPSDLYPEDGIRFCDLDDERWPCSAITGVTNEPPDP